MFASWNYKCFYREPVGALQRLTWGMFGFLLRVATIVIGFILTVCNLLFSWRSLGDINMDFISKQMLHSMKCLQFWPQMLDISVWSEILTTILQTVIISKYDQLSNCWWVASGYLTLCVLERKEKEKYSKKVEWSHVVLTASDKRKGCCRFFVGWHFWTLTYIVTFLQTV